MPPTVQIDEDSSLSCQHDSGYFVNPGETSQGGNLPKPLEPSWRQDAILRALHLMGFMLCMLYPSLAEPILMPAAT